MKTFSNLSTFQKGIGAIVLGAVLLLYTRNLPLINYIITTAGILLILYGLVLTDYANKILKALRKK